MRYSKIVADGDALDRLAVDLFLESRGGPPETLWLDLDATDDPLHGAQEGRFFHGYYRHYCYLPLYIFSGGNLLCARLRPADRDAAKGGVKELRRIVARIRRRWPGARIVVRGDSGFCREDIMDWCERNGVDYVLGLARNDRLARRIDKALRKSRRRHAATGKASRRFRQFRYRTRESWSRTRRVVAKAEWLAKGANPRFVVTSLSRKAAGTQHLYEKLYCARGDYGEQDQGVPAGDVRRPHQFGHAARQPTSVALRLLRLPAGARAAPPGARRHALGERAVRHDPGALAEGRRPREDHRAQGLGVVPLGVSVPRGVRRHRPGGPRPARVAGSRPCAIPTGPRRGRASPRGGRDHAETAVSAAPAAAGLRPDTPTAVNGRPKPPSVPRTGSTTPPNRCRRGLVRNAG